MAKFVRVIIVIIVALVAQPFMESSITASPTVYICVTGKVYHFTRHCKGLSKATHRIKAVSLEDARRTRRACKICY